MQCLLVVEQIDIKETVGAKVIQVREKEIVDSIMQPSVKTEVSHLLAKMSAVPTKRRLSIMPGIRVEDDSTKLDIKVSVMVYKNLAVNFGLRILNSVHFANYLLQIQIEKNS